MCARDAVHAYGMRISHGMPESSYGVCPIDLTPSGNPSRLALIYIITLCITSMSFIIIAMVVSLSVLVGSALAVALIYKYVLSPSLFSPLSKIPAAHPTARISSAWITWIRYTFTELRTIHDAHARLGPVILLGPNEVSVNCVKGGIQSIYSGGFEKHEWYNNMFTNFGYE